MTWAVFGSRARCYVTPLSPHEEGRCSHDARSHKRKPAKTLSDADPSAGTWLDQNAVLLNEKGEDKGARVRLFLLFHRAPETPSPISVAVNVVSGNGLETLHVPAAGAAAAGAAAAAAAATPADTPASADAAADKHHHTNPYITVCASRRGGARVADSEGKSMRALRGTTVMGVRCGGGVRGLGRLLTGSGWVRA